MLVVGHTQIVHLGGAEGGPASQRRADAYAQAMKDHGLDAHVHVESAEYTEASGQAAADRIFDDRPKTTAITCVNDLVALGAMSAATKRGLRIPDDITITGYDNTFLAGIDAVSLTSVDTEAEQIGRVAASWLTSRDSMPSPGTEVLITPTLFTRRSTLGLAASIEGGPTIMRSTTLESHPTPTERQYL